MILEGKAIKAKSFFFKSNKEKMSTRFMINTKKKSKDLLLGRVLRISSLVRVFLITSEVLIFSCSAVSIFSSFSIHHSKPTKLIFLCHDTLTNTNFF